MKSGLTTVADNSQDLKEALAFLRNTKIMVGIPSPDDPDLVAKSATEIERPGPASNAVIGYVLENGDPARNLPARPFLAPGVDSIRDGIAESLQKAGQAALAGDKTNVQRIYNNIGLRAVNAVRAFIDAQNFAPLAPSTLEARFAKLSVKEQNRLLNDPLSDAERALRKQGVPTSDLITTRMQGAIKILIDTGSLRNSLTYVLRGSHG